MSCLPTPEGTCNRKPFATDSSCDRGDVDLTPFADFPACSPISPTPPNGVEPPLYYPVVPPITPPPCACIDIDYNVNVTQGDEFDFKAVFGAIGDCCEGKYRTDFEFQFPCIPEIVIQTEDCAGDKTIISPQSNDPSSGGGCVLTYTIPVKVPEITIQTRECNSNGSYESPQIVVPTTDSSESGGSVCNLTYTIDMPCIPCVPEITIQTRECNSDGTYMPPVPVSPKPTDPSGSGCDLTYTIDMPCIPCVPAITIQTRECNEDGTYKSPVPVSPKPTDPSGSGCDLTYTIDMPCPPSPPCVPVITIQTRECGSDGSYSSPVPVSPKPTDPSGSGCDLTYTIDMPCPPCVPEVTYKTKLVDPDLTGSDSLPISYASDGGCDYTVTIPIPKIPAFPCIPRITIKTRECGSGGSYSSPVEVPAEPTDPSGSGCDLTYTIDMPCPPCVPEITIQTRECNSDGTYGSPVPVSPKPTDPSGGGCDLTYTIDMPCLPCVPQVTYVTKIVSPSDIKEGVISPEDASEGCDYTITIPIPKVPCLPHITMKYVTVDSSGEPIGEATVIPQTGGTTDCDPEFVIPIPCTPKISISANVVNVGDDDDFGVEVTPPGEGALCNQDFNIELRVPGYLNGGGGGGGDSPASSSPSSDPCGDFDFEFTILDEHGESADSFCIGDLVTVIAKVTAGGEDVKDKFKGKGYSIDYSWGQGPYLEGASGTDTIVLEIGENIPFGTNGGVLNVTIRRMGKVICSQTSQPFNFNVRDCRSSSESLLDTFQFVEELREDLTWTTATAIIDWNARQLKIIDRKISGIPTGTCECDNAANDGNGARGADTAIADAALQDAMSELQRFRRTVQESGATAASDNRFVDDEELRIP